MTRFAFLTLSLIALTSPAFAANECTSDYSDCIKKCLDAYGDDTPDFRKCEVKNRCEDRSRNPKGNCEDERQ